MSLSTSLANTILTTYFSTPDTWLSLHTTPPLSGGLANGEITATGYHRQQVDWSPASNRTVFNLNDLSFTGLPLATIGYFGVYTKAAGGTLQAQLEITTPYNTNSNGSGIYVPAQTLVIELP